MPGRDELVRRAMVGPLLSTTTKIDRTGTEPQRETCPEGRVRDDAHDADYESVDGCSVGVVGQASSP